MEHILELEEKMTRTRTHEDENSISGTVNNIPYTIDKVNVVPGSNYMSGLKNNVENQISSYTHLLDPEYTKENKLDRIHVPESVAREYLSRSKDSNILGIHVAHHLLPEILKHCEPSLQDYLEENFVEHYNKPQLEDLMG